MQDAIFIHDKVLRQLIPQYCGSEVMTEGDAFILAFHEEADALLYCLHTQEALLQAPWPPAILDHENAATWKRSQELNACLSQSRYEYMHAHMRDRLFARNSDLVRRLHSDLRSLPHRVGRGGVGLLAAPSTEVYAVAAGAMGALRNPSR